MHSSIVNFRTDNLSGAYMPAESLLRKEKSSGKERDVFKSFHGKTFQPRHYYFIEIVIFFAIAIGILFLSVMALSSIVTICKIRRRRRSRSSIAKDEEFGSDERNYLEPEESFYEYFQFLFKEGK